MSVGLREIPLRFSCGRDRLVGVLALPANPAPIGVLIVTGGPQYRVGSHRQFVTLARFLATQGLAVLRFDVRGMGDSDGVFPGFEAIDRDIAAALNCLVDHLPNVETVLLWGLCDAASAIMLYAHSDARVKGIAVLNPWVRTDTGLARAYVKHYYGVRLLDRELWRKIARGEFDVLAAGRGFLGNLAAALRLHVSQRRGNETAAPLPERMCRGLGRFHGPVLLVLSGRDLTAKEFEDAVAASSMWRRLLEETRVTVRRLDESDHTFSRREWGDQVAHWTLDWVRAFGSAPHKRLARHAADTLPTRAAGPDDRAPIK